MKRFFVILLVVPAVFWAFSCGGTPQTTAEPVVEASPASEPAPAAEEPPTPEPASAEEPEPTAEEPPPQEPEPELAVEATPSEATPSEEAPPPPPSALPLLVKNGIILEGARTHKVVWRDTLSSIAKKYYGKSLGYYFPLIMLANIDVVTNPDKIIPGTILIIPDLKINLGTPVSKRRIKESVQETAAFYRQKGDLKTANNLAKLAASL